MLDRRGSCPRPPRSFEVDAVVFDLDGVLVRSETAIERAWKRWAKNRGVPWASLRSHIHGRLAVETILSVLPDLSKDVVRRESEEVMALQVLDTLGCKPVPGVRKLVGSIPRDCWAIVTGCTPELAQSRLAAARFPEPATLISCRDVAKGKPDPEGFKLAAKRLGVECHRCVALEDSPSGILAAQRAGMAVIALTTTHRIEALGAPEIAFPDARRLRVRSGTKARLVIEAIQ